MAVFFGMNMSMTARFGRAMTRLKELVQSENCLVFGLLQADRLVLLTSRKTWLLLIKCLSSFVVLSEIIDID